LSLLAKIASTASRNAGAAWQVACQVPREMRTRLDRLVAGQAPAEQLHGPLLFGGRQDAALRALDRSAAVVVDMRVSSGPYGVARRAAGRTRGKQEEPR